jgi:hypothetical protein
VPIGLPAITAGCSRAVLLLYVQLLIKSVNNWCALTMGFMLPLPPIYAVHRDGRGGWSVFAFVRCEPSRRGVRRVATFPSFDEEMPRARLPLLCLIRS